MTPQIFQSGLIAVTFIFIVEANENKFANPPPPLPSNGTYFQTLSQERPKVECGNLNNGSKITPQNGIIGDRYRWQSFNVYVDPAYTDEEYDMIRGAQWQIMDSFPCIRYGLWPRGQQPWGDYVHIKKWDHPTCWSPVGKQGGMQEMSMRPECMHHGLLVHELIHAIGLEHEHSRPDRDDYITIHYENIQPGWEFAFRKMSPSEYSTFGVEYNERSVVHYWGDSYSKDGKPTITSKRGREVGMEWPSGRLQDTDILKLRRMYKCQ